ncbi:MAG TPA: LPS-assembly protein LptD [Pseudolabrys sp.]|nr:LPS-assembly protein LptD [Pseudolabrys sp.]
MAGPVRAHPSVPRPSRRSTARVTAVLAVLAFGCALAVAPALAQQTFQFPPSAPKKPKSAVAIARENAPQQQMLVKADEIDYDYANHRVSAVGNVQIYYRNSTLEADKVVYDQTSKRLHAEGNVRLTDADGRITHGTIMDLSDDYRDGFVDSLRLESPDQTRMAAARAERSKGNTTVFHSGVYTACAPCKDDPRKPPLWQVKAARIIHDQGEKMLYFEDASLEFFGQPLAYLPYFSAPDPTVKRKTGVLTPIITSSSVYGAAIEVPYYWALAPDYDATFSPMVTTKQGPLLQGEFRQRLLTGAYSIRAAGIYQLDRSYFANATPGVTAPGDRNFRGSVESDGLFALNDKWVWGWDGVALTDKTFLTDYNPRLSAYHYTDTLGSAASSGLSQLFLAGKGDRSYFDVRSIYYYGFSTADVQTQIPVIHPVLDYDYTFNHPIMGGELGYNVNFTSLTRQQAEFNAINQTALSAGTCANTADPAFATSANCLLRGIPGTYSRVSADAHWRRTFTDSLGQQFTPFASVRADAAAVQIDNNPGVSNYIATGDTNLVRGMPTVGLEYRFPFINVQSWGTQTVEPIAQIIARPNEPQVGKWPNEDAQSLIFDDTNLFKVDKFSGYDRVEGGGRANYGLTYTAQFNQGGAFNALFGQSYSLWDNSFAQGGISNTGLDSGLDSTRSDYVARASFQPNATYKFTSRFRLDNDTFTVKRTELEAAANFDRWAVSLMYGDYAAQPEIGFLDRRQGVLGSASVKLDANWVVRGSALYDLESEKFSANSLGLAYVNDCLILGLNYITNYSYGTGVPQLNHTIMIQLSLRTLGDTSVSQNVGTNANSR